MIVRTCRAALLPLAVLLASAVWCGGAAAASLTIHAPEEAKQGSAVRVRVAVDEPLPRVAFTWLGKTIDAPTVAEGPDRVAEALLPVPVNASKDLIRRAR